MRRALARPRVRRGRALPTAEQVIAALAVLGLLAAGAWLVRTRLERLAEPAEVTMRAPRAGSRTLDVPLDLLFLVDDSGSTEQSDPHRRRVSEGRLALEWFAEHGGDPGDRLGVARFSERVTGELPLVPAGDALEDAVSVLEASEGGGASTDITQALAWASGQCQRSGAHRSVLILFTDGVQDEGTGGGLDGVARGLDALGCDRVWLVALADGGGFDSVATRWEALPLAGTLRLDDVAPGTVASSLAEIVMAETGQDADGDVVSVR